jgi:hypothetical protein
MGKQHLSILAILMAGATTAPALAQDGPAAAKQKTPTPATAKPPGAVSSSYARCTPGQPVPGVIVKGAASPTTPGVAQPAGACPSSDAAEGRTYTGGRRNEDAPAAAIEASATATGDMPSRLSMTPTTAKAVAPAQPAGKSISEKGVSSTKPR